MKRTLILFLALCLLLAGCNQSQSSGAEESAGFGAAPRQVTFEEFPRMDGSTANLPLMRALAMYYTGISQEEAQTQIQVSTTDYAYYALVYGDADLLLVYQASDSTKDFLASSGVAVEMKPIGLDALVFICNEENPVESLTTRQIQEIYTGKVTNWQEVGGTDVEIVPYQRVELSGSQTMMEKLVMAGLPMMDAPSELRPMAMAGLVDMIAEYQNTANALGYSVYYYIHNMYAMPEVKTLQVDGIAPSNESIQNGSYPFVNEFYVMIRKDEPADSLTRAVYDFLTTQQGGELVEAAGYVPLGAS